MDRTLLLRAFEVQAQAAAHNGSPMYAELLALARRDAAEQGPVARLVADWNGHPILDALPLRVMGAVHERVLAGAAPQLARFYPSVGGRFEPRAAGPAFLAYVDAGRETLRPPLDAPLQTNEVRRSAILLGGFLHVAAATGLPLRLLEIGASAGLNLCWDRFGYALGPTRWGAPDAPLVLHCAWTGRLPPLDVDARVASRAGCAPAPVELRNPARRRRLESFVWGDQPERLARLRGAVACVLRDPPGVERAGAADWLEARLREPTPGTATVLFHSVVWWYLSEAERERVTRLVHGAAARAGRDAPLAWLRLEPPDLAEVELRLTLWPDGRDVALARGHPHGERAHWL